MCAIVIVWPLLDCFASRRTRSLIAASVRFSSHPYQYVHCVWLKVEHDVRARENSVRVSCIEYTVLKDCARNGSGAIWLCGIEPANERTSQPASQQPNSQSVSACDARIAFYTSIDTTIWSYGATHNTTTVAAAAAQVFRAELLCIHTDSCEQYRAAKRSASCTHRENEQAAQCVVVRMWDDELVLDTSSLLFPVLDGIQVSSVGVCFSTDFR